LFYQYLKTYPKDKLMFLLHKTSTLPSAKEALPGRTDKIPMKNKHFVLKTNIIPPFDEHLQFSMFGLGCFWGAEKIFWQLEGVYSTAVGYSAGHTPNPTYQEVCSGMTAHNETVLVVYDPSIIDYVKLLKIFFQSHNPTQGMRQGNDQGTQYRSGIYTYNEEQMCSAKEIMQEYQQNLFKDGYDKITTETIPATEFFYAEDYHQQYLAKNPSGYCGLGGTNTKFDKT